jgi:ferredoxin
MLKKLLTLKNIRRIYQAFFLLLFIVLMKTTDFRTLKGYDVGLFLGLDPFVALSSFLTSWTVYKLLSVTILIIMPTIFLGRFFCSWVCPLGALNQISSKFLNGRRPVDDYSVNAYRDSYRIKYYILAAFLALALAGSLQVGLMDPIALLTRSFTASVFPAVNFSGAGFFYIRQPIFHGGVLIALIFLIILFLNRFITRFWCRVLCPAGALMGFISIPALLKIHRNVEACTDCQKCRRNCHGGCDPHVELRHAECMLCMNCIDDCPEGAIHFGLPRVKNSIHTPMDINRRRFLETAAAGAILFPMLRSVVNANSTPAYDVIRPPGSIPEGDFLRRCIKCGQCMKVCPTNVLQPALLEAGFEGLWSPILINTVGYCEHNCVLCGHVCPTGAIRPLSVQRKIGKGEFDKKPLKIGTAFYDRGRCLPWAMNTHCIVCEEVCPTSPKAIWFKTVELDTRDGKTITLKQPFIDPKLCIGCGICENKCPVHDRPAVRVSSIGETRSSVNQMILKN